MSRGWQRALLLFSLGLNVAFVSLAAVHRRERAPELPPPPPAEAGPFAPRWHMRRAAALERALALDASQRLRLDQELETLRPPLRTARLHAASQRQAFRQALLRGEPAEVRRAARAAARAQSQVDSLSAEALLREMSVLHPDQRRRWARWNLQREAGRRARHPDSRSERR